MVRLDHLLVNKQLARSRTQSQKMIVAGQVEVQVAGAWVVQTKASMKYDANIALRIQLGAEQRYVSRAGLKLEGALASLAFDPKNTQALDVGQSTGGFTDCLLQHGASRVVGVDVGHGQLAEKCRQDARVSYLEGINARELSQALFAARSLPSQFDLIVMDVSFISQTLILPRLPPLLAANGRLISLVKPQFEVGPAGIGRGGLVRDQALYQEVEATLRACAESCGLKVDAYFESPITGGDGNREFFMSAMF